MRLIALIFATALCAALATPLLARENDLATQGRALAERHCAGCHSIAPSGESPHREAPPFRVVVVKWPLENIEEALAEGIVTGHPDMPAFEFDPPQIEALIEYLYTLKADR